MTTSENTDSTQAMKEISKQKYSVSDLKEKGLILLEYISGSQMYGTNTPESDIDVKGIFIMPDEDFTDLYYNQVEYEECSSGKFIIDKDDKLYSKFAGKECEMKFFELRKFLTLLEKNNPNSLEVFDIPKDCIVYKHPLFDSILLNQKKFLTKKSFGSFSGYAMDQTNKAHGKNKKQNWEKERFERKTILDFCHVPYKQGSQPIKDFIKAINPSLSGTEKQFGLVKIPHMTHNYGVYFKLDATYKGMTNEDETSTTLRVSNVSREALPIVTMTFNESAWNMHCDDYRSYLEWQENRNDARWVDVKNHGQKIDGKNMLHMQRLISMATDIANNKGIISRRPEAEELIKIRKGEVSLEALMEKSKTALKELKALYDKNEFLPEEVEPGFCAQLNKSIRTIFNQSK